MPAVELDDLAAEVFLHLQRYSDDTLIEDPQRWLLQIAADVASERRQRAANGAPGARLESVQSPPDAKPKCAAEHLRVREQVRTAITSLPQRQRELLLLHVRHGLTCKQIADRLELTACMVRHEIARAYCQLCSELDLNELWSVEGGSVALDDRRLGGVYFDHRRTPEK